MRQILLPFATALLFVAFSASMSQAACYAEYKAKRDRPLRLHYGIVELNDRACRNKALAERVVRRRIAADGWTLLTVMSTFGESGLEKRRANAGEYYLRY